MDEDGHDPEMQAAVAASIEEHARAEQLKLDEDMAQRLQGLMSQSVPVPQSAPVSPSAPVPPSAPVLLDERDLPTTLESTVEKLYGLHAQIEQKHSTLDRLQIDQQEMQVSLRSCNSCVQELQAEIEQKHSILRRLQIDQQELQVSLDSCSSRVQELQALLEQDIHHEQKLVQNLELLTVPDNLTSWDDRNSVSYTHLTLPTKA